MTLTAGGLAGVAALVVLVDDSSRTALLTLVAVIVIAATRLRFALIGGAVLATVMAGLAIGAHGPTADTRPAASVLPAAHHHHARPAAHAAHHR